MTLLALAGGCNLFGPTRSARFAAHLASGTSQARLFTNTALRIALAAVLVGGCDSNAPSPNAEGAFVLQSIGGVPLPATVTAHATTSGDTWALEVVKESLVLSADGASVAETVVRTMRTGHPDIEEQVQTARSWHRVGNTIALVGEHDTLEVQLENDGNLLRLTKRGGLGLSVFREYIWHRQ